MEVDQAKISVIKTLMPPTIIRGIRSFPCHVSFYRRFIKEFSKIAIPLSRPLEKYAKFDFDDACRSTFEEIKARLVMAPVIETLDWSKDFEIVCDASDFAMGEVLGQRIEKSFKAIHYASRTFNEAQENYSITEKEIPVKNSNHASWDIMSLCIQTMQQLNAKWKRNMLSQD